ncbi:PHO85 cyclin-1 [Entomophthora muscae]|uniref:PHO85 cyclin-1 n=1 Tax=Entomophthora muscae TaxID=34485 RepID=A0ACC2TGG0_9FUNG|nr:PHO85 cyclin-1 [Entomophthora muscae]
MDQSFKQFLTLPVTRDFVAILAWKVGMVVGQPATTAPLPSLTAFARSVIVNSRIQPSTLFGAMVYLERLGTRFTKLVASHPCAPHRVLLASLVLAGKFLNDSSPKNRHWATYSQLFTVKDVNLMEHQFLTYLNYSLKISSKELLTQYESFRHLPHSPPPLPKALCSQGPLHHVLHPLPSTKDSPPAPTFS